MPRPCGYDHRRGSYGLGPQVGVALILEARYLGNRKSAFQNSSAISFDAFFSVRKNEKIGKDDHEI